MVNLILYVLRSLLMKDLTHEEMLEIAAEREAGVIHARVSEEDYQKVLNAPKSKPFYRFFAIEYFATGEGMSFWLKVCRNHDLYNNIDYDLERFVKFIGEGADHYIHGLTQPTQDQFMIQYSELIPRHVVKMIERKDQPEFDWETHFHFNYS